MTARAFALSALLLLAGCAQRTPPPLAGPAPTPQPAPVPVPAPVTVLNNAALAGLTLSEGRAIDEASAARALAAFRTSCPALVKRADSSGLTKPEDWIGPCAQAQAVLPGGAAAFFQTQFDWARVGDGKAFATGYYEPEIAGSRTRQPGYDAPIYALPGDLVRCTRPDGTPGRGRVDPLTQACLPYFTRAEIDDGALSGRGLEIAWAADPVALFFVEVQGSGRLRLPDGSVMRIGYAGQNGQPYIAIGRLLRERGVLPAGGATMQAIVAWIAAHPDEGKALLRENASYVFFKELTGPGPLGAMGVPVSARASVAADPAFIPLGAPVFLELERVEASGLWIAQDTGGAIKGSNRVDTFWGAGPEPERIAGGMAANGSAFVLLPKGSVERANARR